MKPIRLLRRSEQLNLTLGLDSLRGKIYRCRYFLYVGRCRYMKLIINVNSITFDKATAEVVINGNEVINPAVRVS